MELVIVPAWQRPGFLEAALQRLALEDSPDLHWHLALDRGYTIQVSRAVARFTAGRRDRCEVTLGNHRYKGNSFNLLTAYDKAIRRPMHPSGYDMIHMVEEDVFVGRGYFAFHRQAHALLPDVFAVSACRNHNREGDPPAFLGGVYTDRSYQSLGVSFRPDMLALVAGHAHPSYFLRPIEYCRKHWPNSAIPAGHAEQDGLIHRIIEDSGASVGYGCVPRAYHAGFTGYHRAGMELRGTPREQAERLLAMTSADLNAAAYSYADHHTVPLDAEPTPVTRVVSWP